MVYTEPEGVCVPNSEHGQLFLRLYDSAIQRLKEASEAWSRDPVQDARTALDQADSILRELDAGVDLSSGRAAADLHRIYGFLLEQIGLLEEEHDSILLREIIGLLEELQQSWKAIMC